MKLEEGKWYKWYQKNHDSTHTGKYFNCPDEGFVKMKPWIVTSIQYNKEGTFESKFMQDVVEITDLTEIQKLLPDCHEDKVIIFKSERYLATMKFFNELKEPERSEAIENYDENRYGIPSKLNNALTNGFDWGKSKQGYKYWNDIRDSIENNTYFKEVLVFGKYKIGDIVVSLTDFKPRCAGGIYKVLKRSDDNVLFYLSTTNSSDADNWRLAIPEEVEAYHNGIKNINDIVKKGDWIVLLKPIQGFDVGKLYLVTDMSGDRLWKIQGINCQIDREYYRKATKEECIINDNRILNLNIKPKDYKEAVNCTTQEEWDFVLSKFNPRGLTTNNFSNNSNNKYIITVSSNSEYVGCHSSENYLVTNNYIILTFKEWCDKYGHTYVKEEPISLEGRYIKCLKENDWNNGKTKVGDVLKIRKSDSVGDLFIGPYCLDNSRLRDGQFELLPINYTPDLIKEETIPDKPSELITRDVSILSTSTFYGNTPYSYPLTPKEAYPNYSLPVPTNIILKTKSKSIKL